MESSATNEKFLVAWLQKQFSPDPVPKVLMQPAILRDCSPVLNSIRFKLDEDAKTLQAFHERASADYISENEENSDMLDRLRIAHRTLALESKDLQDLSALAELLSLADVCETSYILGLSDIAAKREKSIIDLANQHHDNNSYIQETKNAVLVHQRLKDLNCQLVSTEAETDKSMHVQLSQIDFYNGKAQQYETKSANFQNHQTVITTNLTHPKLVGTHQELKKITAKLETLRENLTVYEELPPDKDLARVKLEVARSDLCALEEELSKSLESRPPRSRRKV